MPYCSVCKIETDYEYDIALANRDSLHYSCIILLQMRKHEIKTALQKQKSQLILSLFVPNEGVEQDVPAAETESEDLRAKLESEIISPLLMVTCFSAERTHNTPGISDRGAPPRTLTIIRHRHAIIP